MVRFVVKFASVSSLVLLAQAAISLTWEPSWSEPTGMLCSVRLPGGVRVSLPDPDRYNSSRETASVDPYMRPHPRLGFTWQPGIDTADNVVLQWGDIPAGALSTDDFGFVNTPEAIAQLRSGTPVDIVGVGASYMAGAQGLFHDYFWLKGLFYYNLAQGRYALPLYNRVITDVALPLKPRLILYGLNEVSHHLVDDFEAWERSGMDWMTFHSGSWCGPAIRTGFPYDQLRVWKPAFGVYVAIERKTVRRSIANPDDAERGRLVRTAFRYVQEAHSAVRARGVTFVVLLIPEKGRALGGPSPKLYFFERMVPLLDQAGIPYIDLRGPFARAGDPRDLYFTFDNHWNRAGIYVAAQEVLQFVRGIDVARERGAAHE